MANARRGLSAEGGVGEVTASVDCVIVLESAFPESAAIGFGNFLFVEDGIGDDVFFSCPSAEIQHAAALGTEGEVRVLGGVNGLLANGTFVFHGEGVVVPLLGS